MIRTRFAPSPTGYLHVGGLRTALYNYLFAKKNNGKFILRIEDTDQKRKVKGAIENLIETLKWAGIIPDEGPGFNGKYGPYIQSERIPLYQKYANILLENKNAYYCFCTPERLETLRKAQVARNEPPRYDNYCRSIPEAEAKKRVEAGESHVIRMKSPLHGNIVIDDLIRGKVSFVASVLDDQILVKSDGFPTYHLANVVDDHHMKITHVIRGEEWLPSTPKHILLYEYLGWEKPKFAHLPLLLNPDRSKLSKRQGDIAVEDYRRKGYLPEALVNFLALLGWNPGSDREIFSMENLIELFSLERVNKAGAVFNLEKLKWMNGYYIRNMPVEKLIEYSKEFVPESYLQDVEKLKKVLNATKDNIHTLSEITEKAKIFYQDKVDYTTRDCLSILKKPSSKIVIERLINHLQKVESIDGKTFIEIMREISKETKIKGQDLWMSVRVATTGQLHGPELVKIVDILQKDNILKRLKDALPYTNSKND